MGPILFLFLFVILFFISYGYKLFHKREYLYINEDADLPSSDFVSVNGCGRMVLGGYEIENFSQKIYYVVFTLFYIPIIPLKCIVADDHGTSYSIYAVSKMSFAEIIASFFKRISWLGVIAVLIYMFSS